MSNSKKKLSQTYEKLVPISKAENLRVGVNEKDRTIILDFGFFKNDNTVCIDVSKEIPEHIAHKLVQSLTEALSELPLNE